jgi:Fic family protein
MTWEPIQDLPENWEAFVQQDLHALVRVWQVEKEHLEKTQSYQHFLEKMRRKIAIETGVIERLYTIDRGITRLLIETGIDVALIPHGKTDKPASEVVALIRDHEQAIEQIFDFVGSQRPLSLSFIKSLHQLLTRNQAFTEAIDQFGKLGQVPLLKGDWKKTPNNPVRGDGTMHLYCPPEQVQSQMEQLITWHREHLEAKISPEVEAAWLHHRFTQIHPFQDGNGRVARNLASLVFIKAGWFPLVVLDERYDEDEARHLYIRALEQADAGEIEPLIQFFAESQRRAFISSLSLAEETVYARASFQTALDSAINRIKAKQTIGLAEAMAQVEAFADDLSEIARQKFAVVEREIATALVPIHKQALVKTYSARPNDEQAGYYRYQIIEVAKKLNYYANLNSYRAWIKLTIHMEGIQTEWLLSFHHLGEEPRGVMVCSACAWRKSAVDEGETRLAEDIESLSPSAFFFTYQESLNHLRERFFQWIDDILIAGVAYWQQGI